MGMMVRTLSSDRRTQLLNAALKLFVANGVTNTSTAQIAKEAGTAAGTLFLYFKTKQDLLDALVLKIGEQQSNHILSLLNPSLSARETFFTIWHGTVQWFLENMEAYQYLQQVRDSGMISAQAVQVSNKFFTYYYDAIQKGLQEGSIQPLPICLIGDFLYHDIVAVINHLRLQPDSAQREETIRIGFNIYWDGIQSK
jgi:AcrR family transcriptional regulator